MTQLFFTIAIAMAALCAATDASPGGATAGRNEKGLRGTPSARKLSGSHEDTKYCNSIGCPDPFTPIKNAMEVACEDNKCEVSQCCEAFCSYYACPNGYIPIVDAATVLCDNQKCTTMQCCDGETDNSHYYSYSYDDHSWDDDFETIPDEVDGNWLEDVKYCNSIGCPDSFTPIKNAMEVACEDNKCEVSQCCEAFCSYYACPNGYIPTVDAATVLCDNQKCTTAQCCVKH